MRRRLQADACAGADAGHGHGHDHAHPRAHGRDGNRHGDRILRLVGLVDVVGTARSAVVHGGRHVFHPPGRLPRWPAGMDRRTRLVFIVKDIDPETFARTMEACLDG